MATKKTKTFSAVTTVTTVTTSQTIPLTDANGGITKISLADFKAALLDGINLNSINDGIFIMFHRKSDDYPLMVKPDKWTSYQNSGEIAEGVVIVEGGKILVVAPTEAEQGLLWSSAAVSAGGKTTTDRLVAFDDWSGKANTAAQITHDECNDPAYAPGFCAAYSRVNANGLTAGMWWLPSLGELFCIYANMRKINYALSLINGATQLAETWYWSSTEYSAGRAWYLYFYNGYAANGTKATAKGRVRAVSAFLY